jgi:hypothetical protein
MGSAPLIGWTMTTTPDWTEGLGRAAGRILETPRSVFPAFSRVSRREITGISRPRRIFEMPCSISAAGKARHRLRGVAKPAVSGGDGLRRFKDTVTLLENGTPAVRPVRKPKGLGRDGLVAETDAAGAIAGITPLIPLRSPV